MEKLIILLFLRIYCIQASQWKRHASTYNLLRYSEVAIEKTVSKQRNHSCSRKDNYNYECRNQIDKEILLRNDIWRKDDDRLNINFDEVTAEVDLTVSFNRKYKVNNFLLSFKEANNLSAISVEIHDQSKRINQLNYAVSSLLCEFFFPKSYQKCIVKPSLPDGIIHHFKDLVEGNKVVIKLFPPIVTNYKGRHFYSINQLFVGGTCSCLSKQLSSPCITAREDIVTRNDGFREVLLCSSDRWYPSFRYYVRRKRRSRRDACICDRVGTLYGLCKPFVGLGYACPCKPNFSGSFCDKCSKGYYNYPNCLPCHCDYTGSASSYCNIITGQCPCEPKFAGQKCDQCKPGRYNFPYCDKCSCPTDRTDRTVCDKVTGTCHCLSKYDGSTCSLCKKWLENYPICHKPGCKCHIKGAIDGTCDTTRQCFCKENYAGKECNRCAKGLGSFPSCTACNCTAIGSYDNICNNVTGHCSCRPSFSGKHCNRCINPELSFPHCNGNYQCQCNQNGTKYDAKRHGPCLKGESCVCKQNVVGNDCSSCKANHFNLSSANFDGCNACKCSKDGVFANLVNCDQNNGQCICKPNVKGRTCDQCQLGYYRLDRWDMFGCTPCNCNSGGSVTPNCHDAGMCQCKENFEGKLCEKLKDGPFYVPDFYHNKVEIETGTANGQPVIYRYNIAEFANYTGRGYVVFGTNQTVIKLQINALKTRNYYMLIHHLLKKAEKTTMLVKLTSQDKDISYSGVIDFYTGKLFFKKTPSYAILQAGNGAQEIVLTKGVWEIELSTISTNVLVDHVAILPEEYYTAHKLQPQEVPVCLAGQSKNTICRMHKYIKLDKFQMIQAESGTDNKGFGNDEIKRTKLFADPDLLLQLPVLNNMAELSRTQIALTLQVSAMATDEYFLIVTYFNPDSRIYRLDVYDDSNGQSGYIETVPCLYQFLCRGVVLQRNQNPTAFKYVVNKTAAVTFIGNIRGSLAIDYISLIPKSSWSADYILPHGLCYMKNRRCLENIKFLTPRDSIPVKPSKDNPANPLTNAVYAVSKKAVFFKASLTKSLKYVLVYHYYQPNFPSFSMEVKILQGALKSSGMVHVPHCAANAGCRGVFINGVLTEGDVTVTFEIPNGKELWIDSMFLVPDSSYYEELLLPKRTELTTKYKRSCLNEDQLPLSKPPDGFCMQALIMLTSEFTNKTYRCNCNKRGSLSSKCSKIGGQCRCRPGAVGQNCDKCQTGYFGFPYCKACNCFIGGAISADCNSFGQCTCKKNYQGRSCGRCVKGYWGFPDCRECSCDRRGSFTLNCRGKDGQCSCLRNYGGKKCDRCQVGYYGYPLCRSCNCNPAGIVITPDSPTGCYKHDSNRCDCKVNVQGRDCGRCKVNYYGLSGRNPYGCAKCNCSSFGTIPGSGPCDHVTGQCVCQPNVVGLYCDVCKDGYFVVKSDRIFTCQPCLCSAGGSLHGVCDKNTGQCKCKARVTGQRCDRVSPGDYYLPPIGQFIFNGNDVAPSASVEYLDNFDGAKVNESFASRQLKLHVQSNGYHDSLNGGDVNVNRSYYILIYYASTTKPAGRIDLEFTKNDQYIFVTHNLRGKKILEPTVDLVKLNRSALFALKLEPGVWNLQIIFHKTILFNQLTIVPAEHFAERKVSKSIHNPCTIKDSKRYCLMYTFYDLSRTKAVSLEAESFAATNFKHFDTFKYNGANINGAVLIDKDFQFSTQINMVDSYYVILQYLNTESESSVISVKIRNNFFTETGIVELFPCSYAFGCRQVVVLSDGRKASYQGGNRRRYFDMKILSGKGVYLDLISLVPISRWSSNFITPAFYCMRRISRCIDGSYPVTDKMHTLEAESARGVSLFNSAPPDGQASTVAVLLSRYQRNLRWIAPLKTNGYFILIHYYQPSLEDFYAKIVIATYLTANAGKVSFKYCPSIYGCRSVVTYLDEDLPQRFSISGNILRATLTMLPQYQVWVDRITLVRTADYGSRNLLDINPLDLSKRYLRKCVGRKDKYIEVSQKDFCRTSAFELTLGLNKYPQPCKCHPQGTLNSPKCNHYDGQCACKVGFTARDCSKCVIGHFPFCKPKDKLYG